MVGRSMAGTVVAGRSTKDAIRDAAIELFTSKGFEQSSLREVADAVGITKASLYYHYASKVDLLIAIIQPMVDDLGELVESLDEIPHSPETVREVLESHLRSILGHRAAGTLCMRDTVAILNALGDRYPDMIDLSRRMCRWLAGPGADDESTLRAAAAMQVLSAALMSRESVPNASEELIGGVLLEAALGVLNSPR
ncbi:TetR family transcriptional regulator [Nocardia sp. SYP-A9097]|uniref:TetR/AcrR family transcriptional regulator n=1 Tax=Nocardia sp. SYP-A9097 TaxID=2663237 RepID=UPI00129BFDBF|nr:TetR/AcrR family transcriptional regulator [Nocardia sp. SYP-A9097]MRH86070.1 TetR family transcriptional regulator [Nocardia sp. SYP-A9097]